MASLRLKIVKVVMLMKEENTIDKVIVIVLDIIEIMEKLLRY